MFIITIYLVVFSILFVEYEAKDETIDSILSEKYDSYGEDWIFIPDGNNNPQVAVLKGEVIETRGFYDDQPVEYWLYTKTHMDDGIQLYMNDTESILNSDFSISRITKFITHGWKSSIFSSGPKEMKDAYLKQEDHNVIMINWEHLAENTFYIIPMRNTEKVGIEAANFIDYLVEVTGANLTNMHIVGHSLGAHVSGVIGSNVKKGKFGRITGLDPALPGFQFVVGDDKRLDKTDANFVDIIHTCGGVLGFLNPLGRADFYPNGGVPVQVGCCCLSEMMEACSHGRSWSYFTESITSRDGFLATKCDTWTDFKAGKCNDGSRVYMGEYIELSAEGAYFLETRSKSPFAITPWHSLGMNDDDCAEPGGWKIVDNNTRICGTNAI